MEALAALSVACNVMQVISFGYDAIEITNKLRVNQSPDPDLGSATRQLKAIGEELERAVHAAPAACTGPAVVGPSTSNTSTPYPATSSPHLSSGDELRKVAHEVVRISDSLTQELERYNTGTKRALGRIVKAVTYKWKKPKIDDLEKGLHRAQDIMQTRILVKLW